MKKLLQTLPQLRQHQKKTEYDFNLGSIQELVKKGAIPEATALMKFRKS